MRIALWSGPRNLSTALMRSFGSRADTAVVDEPLYGHYLAQTDREHPGGAEVVERCETDAVAVVRMLLGPVPCGRSVFYQKHMAHHLLPTVDRAWLDDVRSAFLIRDPAAVLTSLDRHLAHITVQDTGLPQQVEILEREAERTGHAPAVIDSADLLANPRGLLQRLCQALAIPFDPAMLSWEKGPRDTDGVWGPHWYAEVYETTGFAAPRGGRKQPLPEHLRSVFEECLPYHEGLHAQRLQA